MSQVSLCVPTYDRPDYLRACLASCCAQTHPDVQVVVCDDGSADPTAAAVRDAQAARPGILYQRQPAHCGMGANWLAAISAGSGEYVAVVNDDDLLEPSFAERLAAALDLHPEAAFAFCDLTLIGPEGTVLPEATQHFNAPRAALHAGPVGDTLAGHLRAQRYTVVGALFRREALRLVGLGEPALGACLDYDLWIRLGQRDLPGVFVPARLARYRLHPAQNTLGPGGAARAEVNLQAMCLCLCRYRFADRALERLRREDLAAAHSRFALRRAGREPGRACAEAWAALRQRPGNWRTYARVMLALGRAGATGCRRLGAARARRRVAQSR